jgi:hypothetical protein
MRLEILRWTVTFKIFWVCHFHDMCLGLQALLQLLEDTGADGYNGDTMVPIT